MGEVPIQRQYELVGTKRLKRELLQDNGKGMKQHTVDTFTTWLPSTLNMEALCSSETSVLQINL